MKKLLFRICLILAIIFCGSSAFAVRNWVSMESMGFPNEWIDKDSIKIKGNIITVWMKSTEPTYIELEGKKIKSIKSYQRVSYNCKAEQFRFTHITNYDEKDNVMFGSGELDSGWIQVVPDSKAEAFYQTFCTLLKAKKKRFF